jgi:hypothetical protein
MPLTTIRSSQHTDVHQSAEMQASCLLTRLRTSSNVLHPVAVAGVGVCEGADISAAPGAAGRLSERCMRTDKRHALPAQLLWQGPAAEDVFPVPRPSLQGEPPCIGDLNNALGERFPAILQHSQHGRRRPTTGGASFRRRCWRSTPTCWLWAACCTPSQMSRCVSRGC